MEDILLLLSIIVVIIELTTNPKPKRRKRRRRARGLLSFFIREKTDWEKTCDDGGRFFGW